MGEQLNFRASNKKNTDPLIKRIIYEPWYLSRKKY